MEQKPYLIFSLNGCRYGVEASCVQEVFFLPELTPVAEAPPDIVGVINLRGNILPVMDLDLRLGHRAREYQLTDSVIVLDLQGFQIGIIVHQVHEVQDLAPEEVTRELFYGRKLPAHSHPFVSGVAKVGGGIVMLLNHENLIRYSEAVEPLISDESADRFAASENYSKESEAVQRAPRVFCPHATAESRAIFRERAENLRSSTDQQDFAGLLPLAIIGLQGEYFGLELEMVREFTDIRKVTPIPCTPAHIVGNMNLRGEIVTLVDIRSLLNLPLTGITQASKAMVIHIEDVVAGVTVDEVFDVMYLHPEQIKPIPAAVHSANDEYLRGTAPYGDKMMTLLDMPKILTKGELTVNEEV